MKNENPLVSICIPTYNGAQFIAEAMDSAIAQTYPNLEIVVSDDDSKDTTLDIIETYKTKTNIPIHIHHHQPRGIGTNWNNCIKKSKGLYIKFLFQDDVLLPRCIDTMVRVLENKNYVGLVACKREFIVDSAYLTDDIKLWIEKYKDLQEHLNLKVVDGLYLLDKTIFKSKVFFNSPRNKVGEPTLVLFRKNLVNKVGYFREDLKQVLDYEFYNRILKKHKIAIIDEVLVKFRLHPQQATAINKGTEQLDYQKFDRIMYNQFFWYLNYNDQRYFLNKFNPVMRNWLKVITKLKGY